MKTAAKVALGSFFTLSILNAVSYEYPTLYKSPTVMGMGGAYTAVGGSSAALFYNPAGLSMLKVDDGIELDLINLNVGFSQDTLSMLDDMDSANSSADTFTVLEKYQGSNNHLTFNDFSSVAYKDGAWGMSVGALPVSMQLNFQTHALGSSAGLFDVNGYVLTGYLLGVSYDWDDRLAIGVGYKSLTGKSISGSLTLSQVLDMTSGSSDTASYMEDNFMSDFEASSVDIGATYYLDDYFPNAAFWLPVLGVSVMNIGDTSLGEYGTIPMTLNVGLSLKPDFDFLSEWLIAIDYIDITGALDADYDADRAKHLRLGMRATVVENDWVKLAGSIGSYNANPTYGFEARLTLVTIAYSSYAESIGAYADQELDRRHNLSIAVGW